MRVVSPEPIRTVDYHAGGQPLRIVVGGGPRLTGKTAAERRASALTTPELDAYRRFLCWEPRGHADMYAAYLFESSDPACDFGAVFCHNAGYPASCGHGALALAAYAVESRMVASHRDGETVVTIEVPAGHSVVSVVQREGVVQCLRVERRPSYPIALNQRVATSSGDVEYDLAFSGATFASVDAQQWGLPVDAMNSGRLVAVARELLLVLNQQASGSGERHKDDERLNGVFGVILFDRSDPENVRLRQRAVNIFNDGWIERSPGAAMTGARLALLLERQELAQGERMIHESISGARVVAWADRIDSGVNSAEYCTTVEASAYRTGEHRFFADVHDAAQFSLR